MIAAESNFLRVVGFLVSLLSAATVGLGISDVVIEYSRCDRLDECNDLTTARALTWVGVGIWAGLAVN